LFVLFNKTLTDSQTWCVMKIHGRFSREREERCIENIMAKEKHGTCNDQTIESKPCDG